MKHKKMKHKATIVLILIALITSITGTAFLMYYTEASPDVPSFDAWRPTMTSSGCHVGVSNTKGSGSIMTASSKGTMIAPGETFDLILNVQGFVEAANEGVSLGLNKLDADNALFTDGSTVAEVNHMLDANGDSDTSATFALTAPSTEGIYTLKAYAVESDADLNWVWTEGVFVLSVKTPKSPLSMTYMDIALGAADYLMSVAVVENDGYKWAEANGTVKYQTGFIKGAAGTGYYFLDLYRALINEPHLRGITSNPYQYLDVARGAAEWLIDVAIAANGGYKWPEDFSGTTPSSVNRTGFYYGAAGIGTFFLSMYQATGNTTYLDYAEGAARWLISVANTTVGYAWSESEGATALSTRWTFGAPGIGGFFLQLYQATGNATYRAVAEGAATWLKSVAEADNGGYKWQQREDGIYLLGRWHGAMGVANFFLDMYEALGDADDLAYAEGAARWVISEAVAPNGGYKWENYIGSNEYIRGWTRGPAGIGAVFYRLGEITGNTTYTMYGDGSAEFLINDAIFEDGGYAWVDSNINARKATAMGHGSAGIGQFFLQAHSYTNNVAYYKYAVGTATWLQKKAMSPGNGLAWYKSSLENNTIHTTLYYGVSGIGTFFLTLAKAPLGTYFEIATEAADYLLSVAVVENGGYKWAEANGTVKYQTGFIKGAAGTGYYFLQLSNIYGTADSSPHLEGITEAKGSIYLDVARGAAEWLIDVAIAADGGYKWPVDFTGVTPSSVNRTGFYYGAAGIGTFFLSMYQATGNATYLNYAEGAAQWLIAQANTTTVGYAWGESEGATALSTRWTFGAPGIGGFFLQLYQATGNTTYKTVAEGATTWLKSVAEADGGGYKWQQREDGIYLLGRWHGAMGVANFFLDMYEAFGNADDLAYAEGAARWLISEANTTDAGYKWENYIGSNEYIRGWTRGPAGIGAVFYRLGEITSNSTYTAYGDGSAEFLINDAISEHNGYAWVDSNINARKATAMGHGSAGIGQFFLQASRDRGNIDYYEAATKTAIWLNATAIRSSSLAWYKSSLENNTIHTTLYYGVSGIGTFFLDLAERNLFVNLRPTVTITAPAEGSTHTVTETVTVTGTASDDWAVSKLEIQVNTGAFTDITSSYNVATGIFSYDLDTTALSVGSHDITIKVTDIAQESATDSVSIILAKLLSTITCTLNTTSVTTGSAVEISGTISPVRAGVTVTIQYRPLNGTWSELSTVTSNSTSGYMYEWTPTTAGTYEIKASWPGDATTEGAESSLTTLTVTEAEAPPIDYTLIIGSIVVIVIIIILVAYLLRRRARTR